MGDRETRAATVVWVHHWGSQLAKPPVAASKCNDTEYLVHILVYLPEAPEQRFQVSRDHLSSSFAGCPVFVVERGLKVLEHCRIDEFCCNSGIGLVVVRPDGHVSHKASIALTYLGEKNAESACTACGESVTAVEYSVGFERYLRIALENLSLEAGNTNSCTSQDINGGAP